MKGNERFAVFILGLIIGCVLVSLLINRREVFKENSNASWLGSDLPASMDMPPLPIAVEAVLHEGRPLYYGVEDEYHIWVIGFTDRYPFVRVVWDSSNNVFQYMAADQVIIHMREGLDVADIKPALHELGVRLRMFNRRDHIVVIGTINSGISAVPDTLSALEAYRHLWQHAGPDFIRFRSGDKQGLFFSH
jgi:hypothetical protein